MQFELLVGVGQESHLKQGFRILSSKFTCRVSKHLQQSIKIGESICWQLKFTPGLPYIYSHESLLVFLYSTRKTKSHLKNFPYCMCIHSQESPLVFPYMYSRELHLAFPYVYSQESPQVFLFMYSQVSPLLLPYMYSQESPLLFLYILYMYIQE